MTWRSRSLLDSARGQPCALCRDCPSDEYCTTVACHLNGPEFDKGMGIKAPDILSADLCRTCHNRLDFGSDLTLDEKWYLWLLAITRTLVRRCERGIIQIAAPSSWVDLP
jgi:hypothetical protein